MHTKVRNPLVTWLLAIGTFGIYPIYWAWRVASELNIAENRIVFKVRVWRWIFLVLLLLVAAGDVIMIRTGNPWLALLAGIACPVLAIHVQLTIGNYVKAKDTELGTGGAYSNTLAVVLFWMVMYAGVPYMQNAINRIILRERAGSP